MSYRMSPPQSVEELNNSLARIDNETVAAINSVMENVGQSIRVVEATGNFVAEVLPDSGSVTVMRKAASIYQARTEAVRTSAEELRRALHELRKLTDHLARQADEATAVAKSRRSAGHQLRARSSAGRSI